MKKITFYSMFSSKSHVFISFLIELSYNWPPTLRPDTWHKRCLPIPRTTVRKPAPRPTSCPYIFEQHPPNRPPKMFRPVKEINFKLDISKTSGEKFDYNTDQILLTIQSPDSIRYKYIKPMCFK